MSVRSLFLNAGWSKKTLRPSGRFVTGSSETAQESVGDQRATKPAMRAVSGMNGDAEIKQRQRAGGEERGELHAGG